MSALSGRVRRRFEQAVTRGQAHHPLAEAGTEAVPVVQRPQGRDGCPQWTDGADPVRPMQRNGARLMGKKKSKASDDWGEKAADRIEQDKDGPDQYCPTCRCWYPASSTAHDGH
jgi:hypothetical protein